MNKFQILVLRALAEILYQVVWMNREWMSPQTRNEKDKLVDELREAVR